jgi:hypothetical protein
MQSEIQRRLREKSDELLAEADRLDAIERTLDALPEGSEEIVETAEHAEGQATRLREVAAQDKALTREAVSDAADETEPPRLQR